METLSSCLLCGGSNFSCVTRVGANFQGEAVNLCSGCGLVFLSPRMTASELEDFYSSNAFSEEYRGGAEPDSAALAKREVRISPRIEFLAEHVDLDTTKSALEIGCSCGTFCAALRDRGVSEVLGVDPSAGYVKFGARHYQLDLRHGTFPDALTADDGPYDLIAIFHVLEHLPAPAVALARMRDLLSHDGILFIEVPDLERALERKWLHRKYFHRAHLVDFTKETLKACVENAGFEVIAIQHALPDVACGQSTNDKNVMVLARRSETLKGASCWNPEHARALRERIKARHNPPALKKWWARLAK